MAQKHSQYTAPPAPGVLGHRTNLATRKNALSSGEFRRDASPEIHPIFRISCSLSVSSVFSVRDSFFASPRSPLCVRCVLCEKFFLCVIRGSLSVSSVFSVRDSFFASPRFPLCALCVLCERLFLRVFAVPSLPLHHRVPRPSELPDRKPR